MIVCDICKNQITDNYVTLACVWHGDSESDDMVNRLISHAHFHADCLCKWLSSDFICEDDSKDKSREKKIKKRRKQKQDAVLAVKQDNSDDCDDKLQDAGDSSGKRPDKDKIGEKPGRRQNSRIAQMTDADWDAVIGMYQDGKRASELAKMYEIPYPTMYKRLKRLEEEGRLDMKSKHEDTAEHTDKDADVSVDAAEVSAADDNLLTDDNAVAGDYSESVIEDALHKSDDVEPVMSGAGVSNTCEDFPVADFGSDESEDAAKIDKSEIDDFAMDAPETNTTDVSVGEVAVEDVAADGDGGDSDGNAGDDGNDDAKESASVEPVSNDAKSDQKTGGVMASVDALERQLEGWVKDHDITMGEDFELDAKSADLSEMEADDFMDAISRFKDPQSEIRRYFPKRPTLGGRTSGRVDVGKVFALYKAGWSPEEIAHEVYIDMNMYHQVINDERFRKFFLGTK